MSTGEADDAAVTRRVQAMVEAWYEGRPSPHDASWRAEADRRQRDHAAAEAAAAQDERYYRAQRGDRVQLGWGDAVQIPDPRLSAEDQRLIADPRTFAWQRLVLREIADPRPGHPARRAAEPLLEIFEVREREARGRARLKRLDALLREADAALDAAAEDDAAGIRSIARQWLRVIAAQD